MPKRAFFKLDEDKKERIMRSAIDEFHKCGFEKANVGIIAKNADIAKGSIYWYFENKRELFLYSVRWTLELFMKKIDVKTPLKDMDVFDYFLSNSSERASLLKEEYTLVLFSQDVMIGKFGNLTELADHEMWDLADKYMLLLIDAGKRKGTIRDDIDDDILVLFFKGAIYKTEEFIFKKIQEHGFDITDEFHKELEVMINNMVLLLKQGMGR